jgi:hypothetical protein
VAAILAAVLFLLTLPTAKPFSAGLTLGWGFLLGAILGVIVLATGVAEVGVLSAAAVGPSILLLVFHGYPNEALMGCALGGVFVAAFARVSQGREIRGVETFALAMAAACVAARLGIEHFPRVVSTSSTGAYWALPGFMLAIGALAMAVIPSNASAWRPIARGVGAAAFALLALYVLQAKWMEELRWLAPAVGIVAMGFLAVVFHLEGEGDGRPVLPAFCGALVTLIAAPLAFRALQGYGLALAALAGAIVAAPYLIQRNGLAAGLLNGALGLFTLLATGRLYVELTHQDHPLDFQLHYNLLAIALCVGAAFALPAFAAKSAQMAAPVRMARAVGLGALLTLVAVLLPAIWAERSMDALIGGLAIGQVAWMALAAWSQGDDRISALAGQTSVVFVAAALVGLQLESLVQRVELTNGAKTGIVAALGVVVVIRLLLDAMGHARPVEGASDEAAS